MIREDYIREISDALAEFEVKVRNRNSIHLFDVNTEAEDFICGLLNRIYGYSLHNLNTIVQQNYPGIDLGSTNDGIAVQVTADGSKKKIQHTIDVFVEKQYYVEYPRLVVLIIGKKKSNNKSFETKGYFEFVQERDVLDIQDLLTKIKAIANTEKIVEIARYIQYEIGKIDCDGSSILKLVEQEYKSVKALYISKMTSLEISREQAVRLLKDDIKSERFDYILDSGDSFLVGDYGTGKSHALYVLFIKQFIAFKNEETCVIPRYASIREIIRKGGIESWAGIEWLDSYESILFLDGLDEVEYQEINRISYEVEYMTERYRNCRIIIGSRQLSLLTDRKCVHIKSLDDASIDRIYQLLTGYDNGLSIMIKRTEHDSYMRMLNRPFFLLIYCRLSKDQTFDFSNEIDIINAFIERSIGGIGRHVLTSSDKDTLCRFAAQVINRNLISVHETEIYPDINKYVLLRSGLVVRDQNGFYSFPLPIIAQWLAASALKTGIVDVAPIVSDRKRLMSWRYPISIYFSMASFDDTKDFFAKIVINHPGISGMIIKDGIKRVRVGFQEESGIAGEKLQYCMKAWVKGAKDLLKLLGFTQDGVNPNSLTVYVYDSFIKYSWARKRLEYACKIAENIDYDSYCWQITRSVPQQSTWPWIITYETIKDKLESAIKNRELILPNSLLENEFIWKTALEKKKHGPLFYDEILIDDLMRYCPDSDIIQLMNNKDKRFYEHITDLNNRGIVSIGPPFPVGDRKGLKDRGWIWNDYSGNQMLKRIRFEYRKGIAEYNKIVEVYFSAFKDELSLFVVQPAKIVGQLIYDDHIDSSNLFSGPKLTTYILPLNKDEDTTVDISYENVVEPDSEEVWKSIKNSIDKYRSDNKIFVYNSIRSGVCFEATTTPVTDWVYERLKNDLEKICWYD